jgi:predicted Zn-dependent protease
MLNEYITDGYSYYKRVSVAGHELGHMLGLAHNDWTLMDQSDYWRYDVAGIYSPTYTDVEEVNALY